MRQYLRSPGGGPIITQAGTGGAERLWDLRGGHGGVWTNKGMWLGWSEVCGAWDEVLFGDGKGAWGEGEEEEPVYNKFGKLIKGVERKGGRGG